MLQHRRKEAADDHPPEIGLKLPTANDVLKLHCCYSVDIIILLRHFISCTRELFRFYIAHILDITFVLLISLAPH